MWMQIGRDHARGIAVTRRGRPRSGARRGLAAFMAAQLGLGLTVLARWNSATAQEPAGTTPVITCGGETAPAHALDVRVTRRGDILHVEVDGELHVLDADTALELDVTNGGWVALTFERLDPAQRLKVFVTLNGLIDQTVPLTAETLTCAVDVGALSGSVGFELATGGQAAPEGPDVVIVDKGDETDGAAAN